MLPKTLPFIVSTFTIKLASQCQAFYVQQLPWKLSILKGLQFGSLEFLLPTPLHFSLFS